MRRSIGMDLTAKPWTSRIRTQLTGLNATERVRDLIDVAWFSATKDAADHIELERIQKHLVVDVSQAVDRRPWSMSFSTLTTNSECYVYHLDRTLLESEKFYLLGFPKWTLNPVCLSQNALRDLAGECMGVPDVTAVCYAALLNARLPGFWPAHSSESTK